MPTQKFLWVKPTLLELDLNSTSNVKVANSDGASSLAIS